MELITRAASGSLLSCCCGHYIPFWAGCLTTIRRPWQSRAVAAHQAHNLEVGGPNPSSAPIYTSILITSLNSTGAILLPSRMAFVLAGELYERICPKVLSIQKVEKLSQRIYCRKNAY